MDNASEMNEQQENKSWHVNETYKNYDHFYTLHKFIRLEI